MLAARWAPPCSGRSPVPDLIFSASDGRFHDAAGRFVSDARVRQVIDGLADASSQRMALASDALLDGRMSLGAWEIEMRAVIRTSHVAATVLAHGGADQMSPTAYLVAARDIKAQYRYATAFAAQIGSGEQGLNRTIVSRSEMYGQHVRVLHEGIVGAAAVGRGMDEAMNTTHAQESCQQCRALSARGWIPASEMPPVGSRTCLSRCTCVIQRRSSAAGRQAA